MSDAPYPAPPALPPDQRPVVGGPGAANIHGTLLRLLRRLWPQYRWLMIGGATVVVLAATGLAFGLYGGNKPADTGASNAANHAQHISGGAGSHTATPQSATAALTTPGGIKDVPKAGGSTSGISSLTGGGSGANGDSVGGSVATGSGSCPLPAYPTPSCTGVPAGTAFTNTVNGDYTVTTAGQHIDKWHITGSLDIRAGNVVVTNSQIDGTVNNDAGSVGGVEQYPSFTISDSTVGPPGACTSAGGRACVNAGSHSTANCLGSPGVGEGNYTATRVYVRGHDDGFRVSGPNVTVQDSYFYACYLDASLAPPDGSHSDGVQTYCSSNPACSSISIRHTTLDLSGVPATFPINLGDPSQSSVTISNNLLLGGQNYLMYMKFASGPTWTVSDNRLVKDTWLPNAPWPRIDGAITAEGTCSHQSWSGNTVVTIDSNYAVTGTVGAATCVD